MALTITHPFVSAIADDPAAAAAGQVVPSKWNAVHSISGTLPAANVSAAGSNTQVQYNNSGVLGASSAVTFDGTALNTNVLNIPTTSSSSVGVIDQNGSSLFSSFGTNNIFLGALAGNFTMTNTGVGQCVGIGTVACNALTTGYGNVGIGFGALAVATSAVYNVAIGANALVSNKSDNFNIAIGGAALASEGIGGGGFNTAIGYSTLTNLTSGFNNFAIGIYAGLGITTGANNLLLGSNAAATVLPSGLNSCVAIGMLSPAILAALANNAIIFADGAQNIRYDYGQTYASTHFLNGGAVYTNVANFILGSKTTITGGSTGNVPTLTAGPVTGNPTKWLPYDDNGTTRYIPSW